MLSCVGLERRRKRTRARIMGLGYLEVGVGAGAGPRGMSRGMDVGGNKFRTEGGGERGQEPH